MNMNGEKYTLEFYSKGFFGYGKEGAFRQWSPAHFAAFAVLAAGILPLILGGLGTAAILAWIFPYYEMCVVGFYEAVKTPIEIQPPDEEL